MVHIDIQPHVLMGNNLGADCYVQGEATVTTQAIIEMLEKKGVSNEGYRTAAVRKILREAGRDPAEFEIEPGTVDPREAARLMDERLPANVGLVTGNAHNFAFPAMGMKKPRQLQNFVISFGCIGQALATAIGICVATGEPIVCVEGDGGALQTIQELDTAARLGVKLLYLVFNDEAYGAEYHKLRASGRDGNLSVVRTPDFGALGRDFGCRGRTARTLEELAAGLDEFLAGAGPMVIDLRISRNVTSIPFRRLSLGQDV
jgi:thiamine pyrophosphate-dependent acetolactate synthase large subunit-like protein